MRARAALTIEWALIITLKKCWRHHLVHLNSFLVSTNQVGDGLLDAGDDGM